jgi:hypothetical protein
MSKINRSDNSRNTETDSERAILSHGQRVIAGQRSDAGRQ